MLPVPSWWPSTIADSHRRYVKVDVVYGGDIVAADIAVMSGTVTMDRSALIRGRIDLVVADPLLIPNGAADPLAPFGAELVVQLGAAGPDGVVWWVPWGVFGIQTAAWSLRDKVTTITGRDRFQAVTDAGLETEIAIAAGTNTVTAIQTLLSAAKPDLAFATPATTTNTTNALIVSVDDDPVGKAVELAQSAGLELFIDHSGLVACNVEPQPVDPVVTVGTGIDGVLVDLDRSFDRSDAVNRVVVTGNHTTSTAAIQGVATDTLPSSPTMWGGPFGRKPLRVSSVLASTSAMALDDATARLSRLRGVPSSISLGMVPNEALQCSDAVTVDGGPAVGVHVVDEVRMPLGAADGAATIRTRQVIVG